MGVIFTVSVPIAIPSCLAMRKNGVLGVAPLLLFDLNIRQRVREEKLEISGGGDQPLTDLFCWIYSCSKVLLATVLLLKRNMILFFHWRQLK